MSVTRRQAIMSTLMTGGAALLPLPSHGRSHIGAIRTTWIDGKAPAHHLGQTFGVAWPQGSLSRGEPLRMVGADGEERTSDYWTLATWPDGSVKWTAHALPASETVSDTYAIDRGKAKRPAKPVLVLDRPDSVTIDTGACTWTIQRSGEALISSARIDGRTVIGEVRLVAQSRSDPDGPDQHFTSRIETVTVEQKGPVRAVIKIQGRHAGSDRRWLPFSVRLYAFAGDRHLRIVHSFVFDGNPALDFLSGLGIAAQVPMAARSYDRHVRFALGQDRIFAEAVRPLTGLGSGGRYPESFRTEQVAGRATPPYDTLTDALRDHLKLIPEWGDFTLAQLSASGFTLTKRTKAGHGWIDADGGAKAPGLAYVGQPAGGAAMGIRYFRERHPTQMDITGASADTATLTGWLWSPRATPMDLRFYHDGEGMSDYARQREGVSVTYEDYEPGWGEAHGIARTSEIILWACNATPSSATLLDWAYAASAPPQIMARPSDLHAADIFGDWNLPDRSTAIRAAIEDQLDRLVDFYAGEVERRGWLGFWNHGDVMHSYDVDRHQWRYDIGGFAWDNSELSTDLWLWYMTLRTSDARTWRLAEAMTRHTSEVDVHHIGRFAGLGTRHGVQHWGDSSKQPRVNNAGFRRIYYYLSGGDERISDLMRASLHADERLKSVVVERKVTAREDLRLTSADQVEMSFGVLWSSLAFAWLTEWERSGNRSWRDRIMAGMDSIARQPNGWVSGYGVYDLASGRFLPRAPRVEILHLNTLFGAIELNSELLRLIDMPRYRDSWIEYCRWYNAPRAEFAAKFGGPTTGSRGIRQGNSRLTAFAAHRMRDGLLAGRAATEFAQVGGEGLKLSFGDPRHVIEGGVVEWPGISTNVAAQWSLAAIQGLALVPDALDHAPFGKSPE